jgi:nucleotidyltransferase/DNA polymerase involved in DNA repair
MRPLRALGHVDADCFYVSAERVRDRFLIGKPVGVLGNQGACVIAKSYEMKKAGVKTGEPIWEALLKCPQAVFIKRDFRWYEVLSRALLAVVREFSRRVEYYSIDECVFEAHPAPGQSLQALAEALRAAILERVGVPVTVGIGRTRTVAKLIADTAKPFGALALTDPDAERALLARLPVTEISGIAARRAARLAPYGITTCWDLAQAKRLLVRYLLTRAGEALWYELNGDPVLPLHTERPPHKMLARGGSLGETTADPQRLLAWLARNTERLVEELEFHLVWAGQLSVAVKCHDGSGGCARAPLQDPTDRFDLLLEAGRAALARAWRPGTGANRMHLIASDLRRPGYRQRGLFEPPEDQAEAVAQVKRDINARVGRFALRSGATLPLYQVYRDEAQSYDICDVRGKICF